MRRVLGTVREMLRAPCLVLDPPVMRTTLPDEFQGLYSATPPAPHVDSAELRPSSFFDRRIWQCSAAGRLQITRGTFQGSSCGCITMLMIWAGDDWPLVSCVALRGWCRALISQQSTVRPFQKQPKMEGNANQPEKKWGFHFHFISGRSVWCGDLDTMVSLTVSR